jgi:hypothetical protein
MNSKTIKTALGTGAIVASDKPLLKDSPLADEKSISISQ